MSAAAPKASSVWLRRGLVALLVVGLGAGTVAWLRRPQPVAVSAVEVTRGTVEATIANTRAGTVEACQRTRLSTILGGRIERLEVREGDRVRQGQLLMKLWNDDQRAQAALAAAQLDTSRRRIVEACSAAESAEREADRQRGLREQGFISESAEDRARTEARTRRAACQTAQADARAAEARLEATKVEQGRMVLLAPFDGTVAKIVGEVGEYSTPSPPGVPTPPAIDLIDDRCLYVKAPMDEGDAPRLQPGQPVRITIDALPGRTFPGRVRRVAPIVSALEKQARTVDIDVDFDDLAAAGPLRVGYSADVEVVLDVHRDVLRVPAAAVGEGGRVLVIGAEGVLAERRVRTGLSNWEHAEVLDGLKAGEQVVSSLEREGVRPGVVARVEPAASGARP